jgi:hypothetical protein
MFAGAESASLRGHFSFHNLRSAYDECICRHLSIKYILSVPCANAWIGSSVLTNVMGTSNYYPTATFNVYLIRVFSELGYINAALAAPAVTSTLYSTTSSQCRQGSADQAAPPTPTCCSPPPNTTTTTSGKIRCRYINQSSNTCAPRIFVSIFSRIPADIQAK